MKIGSGSDRPRSFAALGRVLALVGALVLGAVSFGATLSVAQAALVAGPVTVTVNVADMTYSGFADASGSVEITTTGFVPGDDVYLYYTGTATYSDRNAGTGKLVTVTGIALGGANANKYSLVNTTATGVGNILPANLTLSAVPDSRAYNGTRSSAAAPSVSGLVGGDTVTGLVQTFDSKNVGSGKALTVTSYTINDGNSGLNYSVLLGQDLSGVITPRTLTINAVTDTKPYDGTTASAVTPSVSGLVGADTVTGLVQTFDTPAVGTGKTLTVSPGYSVNDDFGGTDYTVIVNTNNTGVIARSALTITGAVAAGKTYDGTATAAISGGTLVGILPGETVAIGTYSAHFNNKSVGLAKPVTVTGVTLTGTDAANYTVSPLPAGLTADITARSLSISGAVASDKTYDGTITAGVSGGSLIGAVPGDAVGIGAYAAVFADPGVGLAKSVTVNSVTLTGADAPNYLVPALPAGLSANVTPKALSITGAVAANKPYDGTVAASVSGGSLVGVVPGDTVAIGVYTATFADASAGAGKPVTVSAVTLTGAASGNYIVSPLPVGLTADIVGAHLTLTGAVATSKTYDGTVVAAITGGSLTGVAPGDVVAIGSYTAHFDNRNVGTTKSVTVTAVTLSGADAAKYDVPVLPSGLTADITAKALAITAASDSKPYDGLTSSSGSPVVSGLATGDTVTDKTQTFDTKDVGTGKTLTVTGYTVNDGNSGGNYSVSTFTVGTGVITARGVTVTVNNAIKSQGGTLTFAGTEFTHTSLLSGDSITSIAISSTGATSAAPAGTYPIVGSGPATGAGLSNYAITYISGTLTVVGVAQPGAGGSGSIQGIGPDAVLSIAPGDLPSGVATVTFAGANFTIVPVPGFTGFIHLPITVTVGGVSTIVYADLTVLPADPAPATYYSPTSSSTLVRWTASSGAISYVIFVNSLQVGTAPAGATTFTVPRVVGASELVQVQALGNDATSSGLVMARWLGVSNRLITTIRFSGDSSRLTSKAMSQLRSAASWVKRNHVTKLTVYGFTEKHPHGSIIFRKWLSLQRANRVRAYLLTQFSKLHIKVSISVVGSGGAGKNLVSYRRAEVVANGFGTVPN